MSSIRMGVRFKSGMYRVLFAMLATLLIGACSSGTSTEQTPPETVGDPANTQPGEIPIITAPLVAPPESEFTPPAGQTQNVFDLLSATGTFTRLLALMESADLVQDLQGSGLITLFAPDDDAFASLDAAIGANALEALNAEELRDRLNYHLLAQRVLDSTALRQLDGNALAMANELPAALNINSDGNLLINGSVVSGADMLATNGIVHVIDNVLTPPLRPIDPNESVPPPSEDSISVTLLERSDYSILLGLIETADLAGLLQEDNDGAGWTLFAPSNSAFERSSENTLDEQGASALVNLHLFPGTITSAELMDGPLMMREGSVLVERSPTAVMVGGATIVGRDRVFSNGIIHFVDAPLVALEN